MNRSSFDRFARLPRERVLEQRTLLMETHPSLTDLLEAIPAPAFIANDCRQVLVFNGRFGDICKKTQQDPIGILSGDAFQCLTGLTSPMGCGTAEACVDCLAFQTMVAAIVERSTHENEVHMATKLGELDVVVSAAPCHIDAFTYTSAVLQDVTRFREAERQAEATTRIEALATLLAGLAHELNNPLTIAVGHMGLLKDVIAEEACSDRTRRSFQRVEDALKRIETLVRHYARLEPELAALQREFDVEDEIRRTIASLFPGETAAIAHIEISIREPCSVLGNRAWISRILANLIENAQEAVADLPNRRILVAACRENGEVVLSVSDNGRGMEKEVLQQAGSPLFSTHFADSHHPGLGLFEVKKLMNAMHGTMEIASSPNEGTKVTLRFSR